MKLELNHRKKVLKSFKKTRKAFLSEYFCGFFLFFFFGFISLRGVRLPSLANFFVIGFALFCLAYAEGSRIFVRYKITPEKLIIIQGIIKQNRKNIYFHPLGFVIDINVRQGRIQRFLNYGTVFVKGGDNSFEIKDINQPHQILNLVEDLIKSNKTNAGTLNKI